MLARFVWEIHAWAIPLTFATGWVIGFSHWRIALRRKHPELYDEWMRRERPGAEGPGAAPGERRSEPVAAEQQGEGRG